MNTAQNKVYRQVIQGYPGDIVLMGARNGSVDRIVVPDFTQEKSIFTNVNTSNRMSRVFGYYADYDEQGINDSRTLIGHSKGVVVGGARYAGVLAFSHRYLNFNMMEGDGLDAYSLQAGEAAELFTMLSGVIIEIFNHTIKPRTIEYGDRLAYLLNTTAPAKNTLNLPYGGVIALAPSEAVPDGFALVPLGSVSNNHIELAASSSSVLTTGWIRCKLSV